MMLIYDYNVGNRQYQPYDGENVRDSSNGQPKPEYFTMHARNRGHVTLLFNERNIMHNITIIDWLKSLFDKSIILAVDDCLFNYVLYYVCF